MTFIIRVYFISFLLVHSVYADSLTVGSGKSMIKKENIDSIDSLEINIPIDIHIQKSPSLSNQYFILHIDDNLLGHINIKKIKNKLLITSSRSFQTKSKFSIYFYINTLENITLKSSSDINIKNIAFDKLTFNIDGAIDLKSNNVQIHILNINADGSYNLDFEDSSIKNAKLNLKGAGEVIINIKDYLFIKSKAVSNIYYLGTPIIEKDINFTTTIERLD